MEGSLYTKTCLHKQERILGGSEKKNPEILGQQAGWSPVPHVWACGRLFATGSEATWSPPPEKPPSGPLLQERFLERQFSNRCGSVEPKWTKIPFWSWFDKFWRPKGQFTQKIGCHGVENKRDKRWHHHSPTTCLREPEIAVVICGL